MNSGVVTRVYTIKDVKAQLLCVTLSNMRSTNRVLQSNSPSHSTD